MTNASDVILWSNRFIYVLALVITLLITRREWKRDKKFHTINTASQRSTRIWPLVELSIRYSPSVILVLVAASLVLLELNLFPYTCLVGLPLETSVKAMSWVMIAFFQLARLYYIFGNKQVQSTTNFIRPYPNWLFISLIVLGVSIILYFSAIPWIGLQNSFQDFDFDCEAFRKKDRIYILYTAWSTWFIIALDWIVLFLYFVKLWQILKGMGWNQNKSNNKPHRSSNVNVVDESNNNDESNNMNDSNPGQFDPKTKMVFDRIRPILIKIVSLTVAYQLAAVAMGLVRAYAEYDGNEYGLVVVHFSNAMERVIFAFTVVLMIEHNDKWYQKLVSCLRILRWKYCCICCGAKKDTLPLQDVIKRDGQKLTKVPNGDDELEEAYEDETKVPHEEDETSVWSSTEFPILSIQSAPKPIHQIQLKVRYSNTEV